MFQCREETGRVTWVWLIDRVNSFVCHCLLDKEGSSWKRDDTWRKLIYAALSSESSFHRHCTFGHQPVCSLQSSDGSEREEQNWCTIPMIYTIVFAWQFCLSISTCLFTSGFQSKVITVDNITVNGQTIQAVDSLCCSSIISINCHVKSLWEAIAELCCSEVENKVVFTVDVAAESVWLSWRIETDGKRLNLFMFLLSSGIKTAVDDGQHVS